MVTQIFSTKTSVYPHFTEASRNSNVVSLVWNTANSDEDMKLAKFKVLWEMFVSIGTLICKVTAIFESLVDFRSGRGGEGGRFVQMMLNVQYSVYMFTYYLSMWTHNGINSVSCITNRTAPVGIISVNLEKATRESN